MEGHLETSPRPKSLKVKIIRIAANVLVMMVGLSTGAVIVQGMVVNQPISNNDVFIAGVIPDDDGAQSAQSAQTAVSAVLPQINNPQPTPVSVQTPVSSLTTGSVPVNAPAPQAQTPTIWVTNVAAPSVQSQPLKSSQPPAVTAPFIKSVQPMNQQFLPQPPAQAQVQQTIKKKAKTPSVDLNKLSIAVAMTETHNCNDKVGSAVYNNCYGIKANGGFMHFDTPQASKDYFKKLWAKSYKIFPTYRLAQIYSGNDRPDSWLQNVKYYYNSL